LNTAFILNSYYASQKDIDAFDSFEIATKYLIVQVKECFKSARNSAEPSYSHDIRFHESEILMNFTTPYGMSLIRWIMNDLLVTKRVGLPPCGHYISDDGDNIVITIIYEKPIKK